MYLVLSHTRTCDGLWEIQTTLVSLIILNISVKSCQLAAFQNPGGAAPTSQELILLSACINEPTRRQFQEPQGPLFTFWWSSWAGMVDKHPVMFLLIAGTLGDLQEQLWQAFGWTVSSLVAGKVRKRKPCGSRPELFPLLLSPPDNYLSAVWDQVILGP